MYRIQIVYVFCLLLIPLFGFGQKGAKNVISKPQAYIQPYEGLNTTESYQAARGKLWFVYGDRNNTQTYAAPKGGQALKKINFGEVLAVVAESGPMIHVVKDPKVNYRGKLSEEAVEYGWVKKSEVLLWENCLVNRDQGNLYRKAMMLNTVSSLKQVNQLSQTKAQVAFFYNPQLTQATGVSSSLFEIFFVYKIDPTHKSALLGRSSSFSKGDQSNILGWVPLDRIVNWDQRIALEPNWVAAAAVERQQKQAPARFFLDFPSADQYRANRKVNAQTLLWDDDPYAQRRIGNYRRFPVISGKFSDGVVRVGVMGDINAAHAKVTADQMATLQRQYTQAKSEARQIDILFVVDASKSMEPYFNPISEAIGNAMAEIQNEPGDKNQYRFGAVAYRDFAEGKYAVETRPLTEDVRSVRAFLDKVPTESSTKNHKDTDMPEALYYGLENGLRGTGMNSQHTNIVVLVGDCGNHNRDDRTQVSREAIVRLLNQYYCNMLVFQANRGADPAYASFIDQTRSLVRDVAEDKFRQLRNESQASDFKLSFPELRMESGNNNFYRLEGGPLAGAVLSPPANQSLDPMQLQTEIQRLIRDLRGSHNQVMDALETLVMSGEDFSTILETTPPSESPYVSAFPASILLFLHRNGFNTDELRLITSKSFQLFTEGYAPISTAGIEEPLFQPVLLVSLRELADLIQEMESLTIAPDVSERREKMREAWLTLLRTHIGNVSEAEMDQWSMEEVTEKVFGLPTTSPMGGMALKDLVDEAVVDDFMLNDYIRDIYNKTKTLNRIFNQTDYEYNFISNDITYFWIEQALLP